MAFKQGTLKRRSWRAACSDLPAAVCTEFQAIASLSWSTCLSEVLLQLPQIMIIAGAGHLGTKPMAAAALGNSYYNVILFFLQGAATAIDTNVSLAFGRRDAVGCLTWLVRGLAIFATASVLACGLLALAPLILCRFSFGEELVEDASAYLLRLIPGTPFLILFVVLQRYLQATNVMTWAVVALSIGNLQIFMCIQWIVRSHGDVLELAWVLTAMRILLFLLMAVAVKATLPPEAKALKLPSLWSWGPVSYFVKLAISGGIVAAFDAVGFEAMTFAAATLGDVAIDAHNILGQICGTTYFIFALGISTAATIRVGNLLGAKRVDEARLSGNICVAIGTTIQTFCGFGLVNYARTVSTTFTTDIRVAEKLHAIAPVAAAYQAYDGFQNACAGVLRAFGDQAFLAAAGLFCFYAIGMPTGFFLCFGMGWGLRGLWIGTAIALLGLAVVNGVRLFGCTKWEEQDEEEHGREIPVSGTDDAQARELLANESGSEPGANP